MVDLPDGFLSDFLKPCVALEHLSSIGMGRRVLSMSPTTFPRLHSLQVCLTSLGMPTSGPPLQLIMSMTTFPCLHSLQVCPTSLPTPGPPLPLTMHLEIFRFPLTHLSIHDRGNHGPFGTSSCTDLLLNLQAPPTLRTIALVHFAPRQELLAFLERHFDQFTNVAVGLDLFGDFNGYHPQNTRSFCLSGILDFLQGGVVPEICFRRDLEDADTELSLSDCALLEGFSYVRDLHIPNGEPAQIRALGLVCFGADSGRLLSTFDLSVSTLFSELLRLCQRFPEVRELNIQLSCMDMDMQDALALESIIVSFSSVCLISQLTFYQEECANILPTFQMLTTFVMGWSHGYRTEDVWVLDTSSTEYPDSLLWDPAPPLDLITYKWPPVTHLYFEHVFLSQDKDTIKATLDHIEDIVSRKVVLGPDGDLMNSFLLAWVTLHRETVTAAFQQLWALCPQLQQLACFVTPSARTCYWRAERDREARFRSYLSYPPGEPTDRSPAQPSFFVGELLKMWWSEESEESDL